MPTTHPPHSTRETPATSHARCPRCGYDLCGTVASWSASCPLDGTCSECGLPFQWADVLIPIRRMPRWFIEHPHRSLAPTFLPTLFRAITPWRLWGPVRIWHPVHPRRFLIFCGLALLALHATLAAIAATLTHEFVQRLGWMLRASGVTSGIPDGLKAVALSSLWPYAPAVPQSITQEAPRISVFEDQWVWLTLLWAILIPAPFLVLRQTMRRFRIRPVHLARICAYSAPAILFWLVPYALLHLARDMGPAPWWGRSSWWGTWHSWLRRFYALVIGPDDGFYPRDLYPWLVIPAAASLLLCWTLATRRYLRLPHALAVAAIMWAIAGMLTLLLALAFPGHRIADDLFT